MKRGGEVEVDVPVTKNSSHPSSSGGMIAAGDEGESEATQGGADDEQSRKFRHDDNGDTSLPTYFPSTQGSGCESQKVGKICGMSMRRKEVGKRQLAIVCSLLLWVKF